EALQDDVLLLVDERLDALRLPRHERLGKVRRAFRDRGLLVVIADRVRRVEHPGAFAHRGGEQPGGRDVLEIERRVLAHQHGRVLLRRPRLALVRPVPVFVVVGERDAQRRGGDAALRRVERGLLRRPDRVAARLGRAHHRDARILVGLERIERIDDEEERGGQTYLACDTMNSIAARTSASESDALPPLGGIAPLPLRADCTSVSMPCLMRGAQAAWSPSFGAPATPVAWHAMQVLSNTFFPSAAATAAGFCAGAFGAAA